MSDYVKERCSADSVPAILSNEFHSLSIFLGAYLMYCQESDCKDFKLYVEKNHLRYKDLGDRTIWSYINKAHAFIRDRANAPDLNDKRRVSRQHIRKLGYSGLFSRVKYPRCGDKIQNLMFEFVFYEDNLVQVKEAFLDYLAEKWMDMRDIRSYLELYGGDAATENTFRKFLGFQFDFLSRKGEKRYLLKLQNNNTYDVIHEELEKRG